MAEAIVLTPEGLAKLQEELEDREGRVRDEIGERIRVAREFGDISENSEYDDAKNEQMNNESRIIEIKHIISTAQVVAAPKRSSKVYVGCVVTVLVNDSEEKVLNIVGATEANSLEDMISNESPVGRALIGKKKGDEVEVAGPTGKVTKFTILKISSK